MVTDQTSDNTLLLLLLVGLRNKKSQPVKEIFSEILLVEYGSYLAVVGHSNGSKEPNERQRELHRDLDLFRREY